MFVHFPEISGFHQVRKAVTAYPSLVSGVSTVRYRGKVKIHGTNAAIGVTPDRIWTQSRERIITPGDDNVGFAAWVKSIDAKIPRLGTYALFGEWCGPGIMRGTAINQIESKVFAVFAASGIKDGQPTDEFMVEPTDLAALVEGMPNTYVLPWDGDAFDIDVLADGSEIAPILERVNARVAEVEAEDPWVKATFGATGIGEGLVYFPRARHSGREHFKNLAFKAKGDAHKTVAHAKPAQVDPEVAAGATSFAGLVLTEARLEQGARVAAGGELSCEKRLLGPFLAWVIKDVQKECEAELEASKLTWKQVQKALTERARSWHREERDAVSDVQDILAVALDASLQRLERHQPVAWFDLTPQGNYARYGCAVYDADASRWRIWTSTNGYHRRLWASERVRGVLLKAVGVLAPDHAVFETQMKRREAMDRSRREQEELLARTHVLSVVPVLAGVIGSEGPVLLLPPQQEQQVVDRQET